MKASRSRAGLPIPVRRALTKLGADLSAARRRRRISMELMAQRAFITRKTLARVERGDPGISLGIFGSVVFALGMVERVAMLIDPATDALGLQLDERELPKRVRKRGA